MHGSEKLRSSPLGLTSVMTWGAVLLAVFAFAGVRWLAPANGAGELPSLSAAGWVGTPGGHDDFASAGLHATASSVSQAEQRRRGATSADNDDAAKAAAPIEEQAPTF